ncbi:MAG: sulfite exporter TauE/SafE family protein [Coriobacteriia bacterium]|nr:sulfite exporter TauE/SafE family protein [Coriobacteriia bacterium]
MPSAYTAVAVGLAAGVLSGMFGVGGGVVTTPAIRLLFDAPALIAVGTPLPIIIPTAAVGAIAYVRRGLADVRAGATIGAAGAVFSVAGAFLSEIAGGSLVMYATAALILYMAVDLARHAMSRGSTADGAAAEGSSGSDVPKPPWIHLAGLGVVTGLYSGFLGLGGGFIVVPLLVRWLRYPMKRAIGTSLVAIALLAVPGTVAHWTLGHVDAALAGWLTLGVVPGALIGAKLTALAREIHVEIGFAVLLVVTGAVLALNEAGVFL